MEGNEGLFIDLYCLYFMVYSKSIWLKKAHVKFFLSGKHKFYEK